MPGLMHLVSMEQAAGVETHFAEFAAHAAQRHPDWTQGWLNPAHAAHPFLAESLQRSLSRTVHAKYRWGCKLPAKPRQLRVWHCRRSLAAAKPGVLVIWNRMAKVRFILDAYGAENCIHWEHGAAWHGGREAERSGYLDRVRFSIANSKASARVLQLLWGYTGEVRVCRNALRPSMMPDRPMQTAFPRQGAIRLGAAARLYPVKGIALVLHAVRILKKQSIDVELAIAGAGPDRADLEALAERLSIAACVRFHGAVRNMRDFYGQIHCLVHPPLTEAFGLVAIEAAARGVPVVAAAVDGLPEAVAENVTGYCVRPELPAAEYAGLGGRLKNIPERVYDPAKDGLTATKIVAPAALAAAISRLFSSEETYVRMSRSASEHVINEYRFDAHVDEVMGLVRSFATRCRVAH